MSDEIEKMVDAAAQQISEHVDSVQIFVTFHRGDKNVTCFYDSGMGNYYARLASAREWILLKDDYIMAKAIRDQNKQFEEDDESEGR